MTVYASWYKEKRTLTQESLRQVGENPRAHAHEHWSHASHIMHHVHCDCLAPQYWEYYPNIRLCYIGHPCHSSDFWRTPKLKLSSKRNWNLAAIWGLNEWTIKNCYPLPLISELIAWVQNAKTFTKVNIRWGYNNICIKEGDEYKVAFITNQGLFEPTVMFFGLMNSPATFQTMMNAIFTPKIAEGWLIVYMDDILITTWDNIKFHKECVHCTLEKLWLHDLYLKPEKCTFEQQWMEFLGVILENGTVQMDPAKLKGVTDWPQPQCVTDVHAFLGFTGFYCYFVPNYSNIAQPLIQLTKKNMVFKWTEECKVAFKHLKMLMCSCPILWQPDYTKAFFLATDASAYSVGTILLQEGEINPCTQKPMLCPITYYSATFTPTQHNYDIYKWEFLGVYMPLMKYRPHLAATEIPVTILTDHANLLHWKSPWKVNQRVAWWFSDLQDFNLVFKHVPGKIHAAPDMLSWLPGVDKGEHDNEAVTLIPEELFIKTIIATPSTIQSQVLATQEKAWTEMEEWCDMQGVRKLPKGYVKDNKWAVPTNEQLRCNVLSQYHNSPTAGHLGRDNMIMLVSWHYWWPRMNAWIEQYIKGCAICQQNKIWTTKNKTPLYCIPGNLTEQPFNTIAMDLITQLPRSNGYDVILTIIDQGCSRAMEFLPCSTMITREGIAKLYLQHIFPWFRVPAKMISDRDPHFTSHFMKALTTKLRINHNISTAFHPQTDGLSEWKNQWVEQYLQMYTTVWQDNRSSVIDTMGIRRHCSILSNGRVTQPLMIHGGQLTKSLQMLLWGHIIENTCLKEKEPELLQHIYELP